MATSRKRTFLFAAVPLMILLLPFSIYFIDSAAASEKVARNIMISGVDVARNTREEAIAAVDAYTAALTAQTAHVSVNGQVFDLEPEDVGLTFETEAAVDYAMEQRKGGMREWLTAFSQEIDLPVLATIDPEKLGYLLIDWETEAIPNPAFNGSIAIENREVVFEYPQAGEAIDRDIAARRIAEALETGSGDVIVLDTAVSQPALTNQDFDDARAEAQRVMNTTVILDQDEFGFTFRVEPLDISRALNAAVVPGSPPTIEFSFDSTVFVPLIDAERENLELAPADAYWKTVVVDDFEDWNENYQITDSQQGGGLPSNDKITLIASQDGTTINVQDITAAIEAAALSTGRGELPIVLNAPPKFTTEDAQDYGTLYEVSEFTTYMPGTNRAHNIKLMADLVDGAMVWPGETFSVNEHIGQRTLEKGFKYDCAIVKSELQCEEEPVNIGGGVSQFGTTIFNAIYFGCYEDVVHNPHSIYFTKYPEGREATLGFPSPDVAFRNDSSAPVIIRTSYTNRSITVTFFGNQNGMICSTQRSDRSNVTDPVKEYQVDPDGVVAPLDERVKSRGSKGWNVTNTRIFTDADGNELKREAFFWRYRGEKNVILLHSCDPRVGGGGNCPVGVPSVNGLTQADATAALAGAGFKVAVTTTSTDNAAKNGIVLSSSPSGTQVPGTTITITVGQYSGPPPDPDPDPDPDPPADGDA